MHKQTTPNKRLRALFAFEFPSKTSKVQVQKNVLTTGAKNNIKAKSDLEDRSYQMSKSCKIIIIENSISHL